MVQETNFDPHELAGEQLLHLYRRRNDAMLVNVFSAAVVALAIGQSIGWPAAVGWFLLLVLAQGWHWWAGRPFSGAEAYAVPIESLSFHVAAAGLAGAGWGIAAAVLPWLDRASQAMLVVMLMVATATALPRLAVLLPVYAAYAAGIIAPLAAMLAFLESGAREMVALVIGVVSATLWLSARTVYSDLLEIQLKKLTLERIVWEDKLTGLANRRRFDFSFDLEWRRAARLGVPLSLIMLDVDHFKKFNDRYGHPAGDECLRQVAAALGGTVRRAGDIVARYGGEEFVVLLFHTTMTDARALGERIRQAVKALALRHEDSSPGVVTVSIGGATVVPTTEGKPQELLAHADEALYRAKDAGRNRVEWSSVV